MAQSGNEYTSDKTGPMGQILLQTDIQRLNMHDAVRNLRKMKKLPTYKYYGDMVNNFLALHPIVAMNFDDQKYLEHLKSQKHTPYNIPLDEVLCLAFAGFTYLYHYISSTFGVFDIIQLHNDILSQYDTKLTINQMQGDYSRVIRKFLKNSELNENGHNEQIYHLQQLFTKSYIEDTSEIADRLISPLLDEYYNGTMQRLRNFISFPDIIAGDNECWDFYFTRIIKKYADNNPGNYLSNFSDYTYELFKQTWEKIKGKKKNNGSGHGNGTSNQIDGTEHNSSDSESNTIEQNYSPKSESEYQNAFVSNNDEVSIDCPYFEMEIFKQNNEQVIQLVPEKKEESNSIQDDSSEEWVAIDNTSSQEEDLPSHSSIAIVKSNPNDYGRFFGHKLHTEAGEHTSKYTFRGNYTYYIYVKCDVVARFGTFVGPSFISMQRCNVIVYQKKNISHHHVGRSLQLNLARQKEKSNGRYETTIRYIKFKDKEKYNTANRIYSDGVQKMVMDHEIVQNATYDDKAILALEIFNCLNTDIVPQN